MTVQSTPKETSSDVEQIVRRDFEAGVVAEVLTILKEYGTERWHRERDRVRAAVLKLAGGSIDRLRSQMGVAKSDYRDVLAAAEYPGYTRGGFRGIPSDEHDVLIEADWKQYQDWFTR